MEKEKKTFVDWIKEHKKELILAGVSIASIITAIICVKNHTALEENWTNLRKLIEKTDVIPTSNEVANADVISSKNIVEISNITNDRMPHDVSEHIRNLPDNWKASAEKIATAAEHGFNLQPGQTWVESYRTGNLVA